MKRVLLVAVFLCSAHVANAQTPGTSPARSEDCKLTLSQAPVIRGLRVGTNVDQTLAMFPGAADDQTVRAKLSQVRFGFQTVTLVPAQYGSKDKFAGVKSAFLGFLDGRLNFFALTYDGPEWSSDEQFASKVAESLNLLAVESWKRASGALTLSCDGFAVSVQRGGAEYGPSIAVKNTQFDVDKILRERAEEPKERARRAFKP